VRVGLLNVRFSPNLGDGLLAECMEKELAAQPGVSKVVSIDLVGRRVYGQGGLPNRQAAIRVLEAMPRQVRRLAAEQVLKVLVDRKLTPHWREAMKDLDVVVLGGGNLIADHDLNFPIKIAGALRLAAAASLPVAVFGVGVSHDWSPAAQAYLAQAFGQVRVVYAAVRDERSQALWSERFVYPATTCRDPGVLASRHFAPGERSGGAPRVGLGLTDPVALAYHGGAAIEEPQFSAWYAQLAQGLVAKGYEVVLFTNGSPEDRAYLRRASEVIRAKAPEVRVEPDFRNPGELTSFVSSLDLLLAHRLHACIAAYSFGVPHLGFEWDAKMRSFFAAVDRSPFLVEAVTTTPEDVVALAGDALRLGVDPSSRASVLDDARNDIVRLHEVLLREVGRG